MTIQLFVVVGKNILKPKEAHFAESCPREVANVCHAMKLSVKDTQ